MSSIIIVLKSSVHLVAVFFPGNGNLGRGGLEEAGRVAFTNYEAAVVCASSLGPLLSFIIDFHYG